MSTRHSALEVVELLKQEQDSQIEAFEMQSGFRVGRDAFTARAINETHCIIYPPPELSEILYRGQNKFYHQCCPSLHRGNPTALDAFIGRIKNAEFELLIKKHPFVKGLSEEKICDHLIRIDFEGLAQHYGLKTELIDFTSDPFAAGFFATCEFNKKENSYEPVMARDTIGVIYCYNFMLDYWNNKDKDYSNCIGLQPLPRPGIQKAFSYRLRRNKQFNKMPHITFKKFYHDPLVSLKFYEMFDGGRHLFPEDIIDSKADTIVNSMIFSEDAFNIAVKKYWNGIGREVLKNKLNRKGIDIVDDAIARLTSEEIAPLHEQWPKVQHDFRSKIKFRRFM